MAATHKTRLTLLALVAIFAVPYALSWYLYQHPGMLGKLGSRSNGKLVEPLVKPSEYRLSGADGQAYAPDTEAKKWTLIAFGAGECGEACDRTLFTLQQLRRMAAVDKANIRRAYILLDDSAPDKNDLGFSSYPGTELYGLASEQAAELEKRLGLEAGQLQETILIADPMGNLVLSYPRGMEPKKIFADIEILLGKVKSL